jgi:hypothetical protein
VWSGFICQRLLSIGGRFRTWQLTSGVCNIGQFLTAQLLPASDRIFAPKKPIMLSHQYSQSHLFCSRNVDFLNAIFSCRLRNLNSLPSWYTCTAQCTAGCALIFLGFIICRLFFDFQQHSYIIRCSSLATELFLPRQVRSGVTKHRAYKIRC